MDMDRSYPTSASLHNFWDRNPDFRKTKTNAVVNRHSYVEPSTIRPNTNGTVITSTTSQPTPLCKYNLICDEILNLSPRSSAGSKKEVKFADETISLRDSQLDESFQKAVCYLQSLTNKVIPGRYEYVSSSSSANIKTFSELSSSGTITKLLA